MDFNVFALNKIVDAIDRVWYAVQMTETYINSHKYALNCDAITEISSVSGLLGLLGETTELIGNLTETSGCSAGILSAVKELEGIIAASSGGDASLSTISKLLGDSIDADADLIGRMTGVVIRMAGDITEESGAAAELDSQSGFAGNIQSGTTILGWLSAP